MAMIMASMYQTGRFYCNYCLFQIATLGESIVFGDNVNVGANNIDHLLNLASNQVVFTKEAIQCVDR